MTTSNILSHIIRFLVYILLQVFILRHIELFSFAFCFLYIGAIIALPKDVNHSTLIFISFVTGLLVDSFYNTMGMHTAASVLISYLRPYVLLLLTPQRGYDDKTEFNIHNMGFVWFVSYCGLLTFIHHLFLFFLETSSFNIFFTTTLKVICSTIFTTAIIIIFQYFRKE